MDRRFLVPRALALVLLGFSANASAAQTLDDFEASNPLSRWTFYNGAEYPGATGSLTTGAGHSGTGAILTYDLRGGGLYVSATLTPSSPVTAAGIAFWAKVPSGIHANLRVVDSSGQTFQYDVNRPLEAFDATSWFHESIALAASTSHYGGANDGVLHQPLRSIVILASNPAEPGAKGSIAFDDVTALANPSSQIDPRVAAPFPAPPGVSDLASHLGVDVHFEYDDRALDLAAAAGFSFVRGDLHWNEVESTKGTYDFKNLDALVAALAQRKMGLLLILGYFNPLYPGADSSSFSTVTVPAFAAMGKAVAQHFAGKNVRFEVWNEPNTARFWPPQANAAQYGVLSKAGIAAVHQGNPAAKVATGGLSQFDMTFLRGFLNQGGATDANGIGVHPYRQGACESVSDSALVLRNLISPLPSKPSAWSTEWGYSTAWYGDGHSSTNRAKQARLAVRELLSSWAVGFPVIVYYDIRDDGTDGANPEDNFGLLQNDYGIKPAYVAVRTLGDFARGRTFTGFFDMTPSTVHAMRLSGVTSAGAIVWTDAPDASVKVTVPAGVQATGMSGERLTVASDNTVTVKEAWGPVYLSMPVATITGTSVAQTSTVAPGWAADAAVTAPDSTDDAAAGAPSEVPSDPASTLDGSVAVSVPSDAGAESARSARRATASGEDGTSSGCHAAMGGKPGGTAWLSLALGLMIARLRVKRAERTQKRRS